MSERSAEKAGKGNPVKGARCGTASGYNRHNREGENPCNACARAKAESDVRWRNARTDGIKKNRAFAKAQQRALRDLRLAHPDEYAALYKSHKGQVFAEFGLPSPPDATAGGTT